MWLCVVLVDLRLAHLGNRIITSTLEVVWSVKIISAPNALHTTLSSIIFTSMQLGGDFAPASKRVLPTYCKTDGPKAHRGEPLLKEVGSLWLPLEGHPNLLQCPWNRLSVMTNQASTEPRNLHIYYSLEIQFSFKKGGVGIEISRFVLPWRKWGDTQKASLRPSVASGWASCLRDMIWSPRFM